MQMFDRRNVIVWS